jgi:hypothetical protein
VAGGAVFSFDPLGFGGFFLGGVELWLRFFLGLVGGWGCAVGWLAFGWDCFKWLRGFGFGRAKLENWGWGFGD